MLSPALTDLAPGVTAFNGSTRDLFLHEIIDITNQNQWGYMEHVKAQAGHEKVGFELLGTWPLGAEDAAPGMFDGDDRRRARAGATPVQRAVRNAAPHAAPGRCRGDGRQTSRGVRGADGTAH